MIPLIEDYLSQLIQNRLSYLKSDPSFLGKLLPLDNEVLNRFSSYLNSTKISVKRGYPRTPAELPAICILLSGEEEEQVSLGDIGEEDEDIKMEVLYECNYRIEVWTTNGDLTVWLYHLLKWALLSGRDWLLLQGLLRQKLSGSDFEPVPAYFPEFVYRRALSFWCQVIPHIPMEEDLPLIGSVYVNQVEYHWLDQSTEVDTGGS